VDAAVNETSVKWQSERESLVKERDDVAAAAATAAHEHRSEWRRWESEKEHAERRWQVRSDSSAMQCD
jgi:hypothetical protein